MKTEALFIWTIEDLDQRLKLGRNEYDGMDRDHSG